MSQEKSILDTIYNKYTEQMDMIKQKTGIPGYLVASGLALSLIFVWVGFFERFITNLVGTLYPVFWTMKSLENKNDEDKKQWLTYWVVFAFVTTIDLFSGFILKFIPFYFFLKIIFLIWLFMPNSGGSNIVYHILIVRVIKSFEQDIDNASVKIGEYTKDFIKQGSNYYETKKQTLFTEVYNNNSGSKIVEIDIGHKVNKTVNNITNVRSKNEKIDKLEKSDKTNPTTTNKSNPNNSSKIENPFKSVPKENNKKKI